MLIWFQEHKDRFVDVTTLKTMFLQRYNPWGKTKKDQLQSWNILTFGPQKTYVDEHIDLINTLGDILGQTAKSKMEKFVDTMPTIIQTRLITCKNWEKTTKKAKELEHIIRKCDSLAAALPNLKGPDQSNPKLKVEEKANSLNRSQNPVQVQAEQYTYDDTNNYYHNENYRGQSRGHRPKRGQNTGQFFRGQKSHGKGQCSQNPYQGQYQINNYQGNNYQGNHGLYHNLHRNYQQGNNYGQFRGRSHGHGRGNYCRCSCSRSNYRGNNNYQYHQYYGHDDDYQSNQYGPPCALCGGYNHSPKHCFKGEHDINDIMEKMNISGHQSQQSGLYS